MKTYIKGAKKQNIHIQNIKQSIKYNRSIKVERSVITHKHTSTSYKGNIGNIVLVYTRYKKHYLQAPCVKKNKEERKKKYTQGTKGTWSEWWLKLGRRSLDGVVAQPYTRDRKFGLKILQCLVS